MTKDEKIIPFVRTIVQNDFSTELEVYDLFANQYYSNIILNNELNKENIEGGHHEFSMDIVEQIVSSFSVLSGTILTLLTIKEKLKKKKEKVVALKETWKNELIKSGLSDDVSENIVNKYQAELKEIIQ